MTPLPAGIQKYKEQVERRTTADVQDTYQRASAGLGRLGEQARVTVTGAASDLFKVEENDVRHALLKLANTAALAEARLKWMKERTGVEYADTFPDGIY